MAVHHAYSFDPVDRTFRLKHRDERLQHRQQIQAFSLALLAGKWQLKTFFYRLLNHPITAAAGNIVHPLTRGGSGLETLTRKEFRRSLLIPWKDLPESYPRGFAAAWKDFWKVSIPHHARTILYRNLHGKLPCREISTRYY